MQHCPQRPCGRRKRIYLSKTYRSPEKASVRELCACLVLGVFLGDSSKTYKSPSGRASTKVLFHPPKVVIYDCHCRGSKRYMISLFRIRGPNVLYIACSSCKVTVLRTTIASSESLMQVVMRNSTLQDSFSQGQMDSMVPGCSTYSVWYAEGVPHSARAAMATTFMLSVPGGRSVSVKAVDEGSRCWRRESVIGTLTA